MDSEEYMYTRTRTSTGWTKKKGLLLQTNKHFVFRNYYSVGRRNLSTWSTHEYFLLTNFDVQQNSSF